MRAREVDVRWEWSREVGMPTWGGNGHVRWECPTWGGDGHAMYESPSEILHSLIFSFVLVFDRIQDSQFNKLSVLLNKFLTDIAFWKVSSASFVCDELLLDTERSRWFCWPFHYLSNIRLDMADTQTRLSYCSKLLHVPDHKKLQMENPLYLMKPADSRVFHVMFVVKLGMDQLPQT